MRGIWIYAAQRTTNVGRDHPFVVCQVMSPKDHKRWSRPSFRGLSGYEPKGPHPCVVCHFWAQMFMVYEAWMNATPIQTLSTFSADSSYILDGQIQYRYPVLQMTLCLGVGMRMVSVQTLTRLRSKRCWEMGRVHVPRRSLARTSEEPSTDWQHCNKTPD